MEVIVSPLAYEDQVVAFFRQSDVAVQIAQRYQRGVRPQLRWGLNLLKLRKKRVHKQPVGPVWYVAFGFFTSAIPCSEFL